MGPSGPSGSGSNYVNISGSWSLSSSGAASASALASVLASSPGAASALASLLSSSPGAASALASVLVSSPGAASASALASILASSPVPTSTPPRATSSLSEIDQFLALLAALPSSQRTVQGFQNPPSSNSTITFPTNSTSTSGTAVIVTTGGTTTNYVYQRPSNSTILLYVQQQYARSSQELTAGMANPFSGTPMRLSILSPTTMVDDSGIIYNKQTVIGSAFTINYISGSGSPYDNASASQLGSALSSIIGSTIGSVLNYGSASASASVSPSASQIGSASVINYGSASGSGSYGIASVSGSGSYGIASASRVSSNYSSPPTESIQDETSGGGSIDSASASALIAAMGSPPIPRTTSSQGSGSASYKKNKGFVAGNSDPTAGVKVTHLNANWYYTWGAVPPTIPPIGINFTPMIWNIAKITPQGTGSAAITVVNGLRSLSIGTTDNVLLSYNEPDGTNAAAQGNMTVGSAVSFWPNIVNATVSSYTTPPRIGSPVMYGSVTVAPSDAAGTGKNINNTPQPVGNVGIVQLTIAGKIVSLNPAIWLDNFLIQVIQDYNLNPSKYNRSPIPDFICIHWYGPPQTASFTNYIQDVYEKYNLPIWVTEYSCADWTATCCPTKNTTLAGINWANPVAEDITAGGSGSNSTVNFMTATMNWMQQQPFVERYTWKERYLLLPAGTPTPLPPTTAGMNLPGCGSAGCPLDSSSSVISASNPNFMNQSSLFNSYVHFPTAVPPLTPLGQLYASM